MRHAAALVGRRLRVERRRPGGLRGEVEEGRLGREEDAPAGPDVRADAPDGRLGNGIGRGGRRGESEEAGRGSDHRGKVARTGSRRNGESIARRSAEVDPSRAHSLREG